MSAMRASKQMRRFADDIPGTRMARPKVRTAGMGAVLGDVENAGKREFIVEAPRGLPANRDDIRRCRPAITNP